MCVTQAFTGLKHAKRGQIGGVRLDKVRSLLEYSGPILRGGTAPRCEGICRNGQGLRGYARSGIPYPADTLPYIGRVVYEPGFTAQGFPVDNGSSRPFLFSGTGEAFEQWRQGSVVGKVETPGIFSLGPEQVRRYRYPGMTGYPVVLLRCVHRVGNQF